MGTLRTVAVEEERERSEGGGPMSRRRPASEARIQLISIMIMRGEKLISAVLVP